jgi:lipid-A-disaccharide synthase
MKVDKKLKYYCMPNLLLDDKIIPELVMKDASPARIAAEALAILRDPSRQSAMKHAFIQLRQKLGRPGVIRRAAEAILGSPS